MTFFYVEVANLLRYKLSASKLCSLRHIPKFPYAIVCSHIKSVDSLWGAVDIYRYVIVLNAFR